jgi:hypothetical protein
VCCVLCFVLPPKQSGVLECHYTISYFKKMKIMSYVFRQVSSSIKLQPEKITTGKKGTVVWPSVGINLR